MIAVSSSRIVLLALLVSLSTPSGADRFIAAAQGNALSPGQARFDYQTDPGADSGGNVHINLGFPMLELQARRQTCRNGDSRWGIGAQMGILPMAGSLPGVSIGLDDIGGQTRLGRSFYLAISAELPERIIPWRFAGAPRMHLGTGTNRSPALSLGLEIPFRAGFTLAAENYDGLMNYGVFISAADGVAIRAELRSGDPFLGISFSTAGSSLLDGLGEF